MQTAIHSADTRRAAHEAKFPPLELENRPAVDTAAAAYYLNRRAQTLRSWAMRDGSGPIRPIRVNGRLMWPVAQLRELLGVAL